MVLGDRLDLGCNEETNHFNVCFSAPDYLPKEGWDL